MALFGSKKNTETKATPKKAVKAKKAAAPVVPAVKNTGAKNLSWVLKNPRITEKASVVSEQGVYCFDVSQDASKEMIAQAITSMYNVVPRQVRVATIPRKNVFVRGKWGVRAGGKKAYVYLKKGETIEVV